METQANLLNILLQKERQLIQKNEQIRLLQRKCEKVQQYESRIVILQHKIQKLERAIKRLEHNNSINSANNVLPAQSEKYKDVKKQKMNEVHSQIKDLDLKFSEVKKKIIESSRKQANPKAELLGLLKHKLIPEQASYTERSYYNKNSEKQNLKHLQDKFDKLHKFQPKITSNKHEGFNKTFDTSRTNTKYTSKSYNDNGKVPFKNFNKKDLSFLKNSEISLQQDRKYFQQKQRLNTSFSGCADLQQHRFEKLKTSPDASQFIRVQRCYSGYQNPSNQMPKPDILTKRLNQNKKKQQQDTKMNTSELRERLRLKKIQHRKENMI